MLRSEDSAAELFPVKMKEWDWAKNIISPYDIKPNSTSFVRLKCHRGHSREAKVSNWIKYDNHCKTCQSIIYTYPEIAQEWDYHRNPDIMGISIGSSQKTRFWWKCENKHSYQSALGQKQIGKGKCPYCRSFVYTHPEVSEQWNYEINTGSPYDYSRGSKAIVHWTCVSKKHSFESSVKNMCNGYNSTCIKCENIKVLPDEFKEEWDYENNGYNPWEDGLLIVDEAWWKCFRGHQWKARIESRIRGYGNCSYCKSIQYTHPLVYQMWSSKNDRSLDTVTSGSGDIALFKCKNEHEFEDTISLICDRRKESMCRICNSIGFKSPDVFLLWNTEKNTLSPYGVSYSSAKKIHLICPRNHQYSTSAYRYDANYCPHCRSSTGERELFEYLTAEFPQLKIKSHDRKVISPFEIDIFIPELKIGIEFNGEYYHSDRFLISKKNITADEYHHKKFSLAEESGVNLLFVWEFDWYSNKGTIQSLLNKILLGGIHEPPFLLRKTEGYFDTESMIQYDLTLKN